MIFSNILPNVIIEEHPPFGDVNLFHKGCFYLRQLHISRQSALHPPLHVLFQLLLQEKLRLVHQLNQTLQWMLLLISVVFRQPLWNLRPWSRSCARSLFMSPFIWPPGWPPTLSGQQCATLILISINPDRYSHSLIIIREVYNTLSLTLSIFTIL